MAYKLTWSLAATEDLEKIIDYLERDSRVYAAGFIDDVFERAHSMIEHPKKGRVVPEVDDPSLREVFIDQYRLIYYGRFKYFHCIYRTHVA